MNLSNPIVYVNRFINLDCIQDIYSDTPGTLHPLQQTFDAAVHFLIQISNAVLTSLFSVLPRPA